MTFDLVTFLGGGAIAALTRPLVDVLIKRMARRESEAVVAMNTAAAEKTAAEARASLMDTWMTSVLAPTRERAEHAEARAARAEEKADDALGRLDRIESAIHQHEPWDRVASAALRAQGVDIEDPPPLRGP